MSSGAICFAPEDAAFALEITQELKLQTSLELEAARCKSAADFLDLIEQCLNKKCVIAVLSPASVPKPWLRDEWERVLVQCAKESGTRVAYACLRACPFPSLLKKRGYFDFTAETAAAGRALRRWVIEGFGERHAPKIAACEADESVMHLLDRPLYARDVKRSAAEWLVSNHWRDFQNVYWVECGGWTRAGVLGETAHAVGLRLAGTADENLAAIRAHAETERALYVFEHLSEEFAELAQLAGRASVIVLRQSQREPVSLATLKQMFGAAAVDQSACLRALGRFINIEENPPGWTDLKPISFRALSFFQSAGRMAEAHELLVWLSAQATRHHDTSALKQIRWDESWILESWGMPAVERIDVKEANPLQLGLWFVG